MTNKFKAWLAFTGVAFFWGTTFLAIRIGVQSMPPFLMAGLRHFIGGLLICSFFLIKGYALPTWPQFKVYIINGVLMLAIGNGLVTWAEMHISSGLAALICALTPLSIIGVNRVFGLHKEKLGLQALLGILICLVAQVIIFRDNLKELANPNYVIGIIFIVIAIIGWGIGSIYSKNKQTGINPFYGAGLQMISAGVILLVFGTGMGEWPAFKPTMEGIYSVIYLVIFGSLIGYGSFMYVLKQLPATIVSTYAYINTIVAVILGWLWLDEKLNLSIGIAVVLTIVGVWLVNRSFNANNTSK
ncbi:MAG: multidrug DMT transporter permease [Bacteroidetes bacterium]|nr:MAG: multidrug DMT transporter permease [Bacteroidota bacterium]